MRAPCSRSEPFSAGVSMATRGLRATASARDTVTVGPLVALGAPTWAAATA